MVIKNVTTNFVLKDPLPFINFELKSSLAKWLSVRLRTKRLWVRIQISLLSLKDPCFPENLKWESLETFKADLNFTSIA